MQDNSGQNAGDWCLKNSPWKLAGDLIDEPKDALRYKQAMTLSLLSLIIAFFGLVIPEVCSFFNLVPILHLVPILLPCCKRKASAFGWALISVCSIIGSIVTFFFGVISGCAGASGIVNLIIVVLELGNIYILSKMDSQLRGKLTLCFQECGCCVKASNLPESQNPNTNLAMVNKKVPPQQDMHQNNGNSMEIYNRNQKYYNPTQQENGNSYFSNEINNNTLRSQHNTLKKGYRPPFSDTNSEPGSQFTLRGQQNFRRTSNPQSFAGSKITLPPPGLNVPSMEERAYNTGQTVVSSPNHSPNKDHLEGFQGTTESNIAHYRNYQGKDAEFEGMSQIEAQGPMGKRKSNVSAGTRGSLKLDLEYMKTAPRRPKSNFGSVASDRGSLGYSNTMRSKKRPGSVVSAFESGFGSRFQHKSKTLKSKKKTNF